MNLNNNYTKLMTDDHVDEEDKKKSKYLSKKFKNNFFMIGTYSVLIGLIIKDLKMFKTTPSKIYLGFFIYSLNCFHFYRLNKEKNNHIYDMNKKYEYLMI